MKIGIALYVYMHRNDLEKLRNEKHEFLLEYFETIKRYFLTFKQPPPVGLELWATTNGEKERGIANIKHLIYFGHGGFIIDISYNDYQGDSCCMSDEFKITF